MRKPSEEMEAARNLINSLRKSIGRAEEVISSQSCFKDSMQMQTQPWAQRADGWYIYPIKCPSLPEDQANYVMVVGEKGYSIPEHSHDQSQKNHVIEGRVRERVSGKIYESKDSAFIIPPGVPHSFEALEDCVMLIIYVPPINLRLKGKPNDSIEEHRSSA